MKVLTLHRLSGFLGGRGGVNYVGLTSLRLGGRDLSSLWKSQLAYRPIVSHPFIPMTSMSPGIPQ